MAAAGDVLARPVQALVLLSDAFSRVPFTGIPRGAIWYDLALLVVQTSSFEDCVISTL